MFRPFSLRGLRDQVPEISFITVNTVATELGSHQHYSNNDCDVVAPPFKKTKCLGSSKRGTMGTSTEKSLAMRQFWVLLDTFQSCKFRVPLTMQRTNSMAIKARAPMWGRVREEIDCDFALERIYRWFETGRGCDALVTKRKIFTFENVASQSKICVRGGSGNPTKELKNAFRS